MVQTIILWARQFQVHEGVVTTPLVNHVTKKGLVGRGLRFIRKLDIWRIERPISKVIHANKTVNI